MRDRTAAVLTAERGDRIATLTLDRPDARNALNGELRSALSTALVEAETDPGVDAIVLTGAGPAFCAGLDLRELAADPTNAVTAITDEVLRHGRGPFPPVTKPIIGAINGAAVTGGLELALNCDFLVASDRARFADTHARVGLQPGWGLTVLLAEAVGVRRAKELSTTGRFIDAPSALAWGLVNHVVPHDELLPFAWTLAAEIAANDPASVQRVVRTYDEGRLGTADQAWENELRVFREWRRSTG